MKDWDELSADTIQLKDDTPKVESSPASLIQQAKYMLIVNTCTIILWWLVNVDEVLTMLAVSVGVLVAITGLLGKYGLGVRNPVRIWVYSRVLSCTVWLAGLVFAITVIGFMNIERDHVKCEHIEETCPMGIEHYKYIFMGTIQGNATLYYFFSLIKVWKYKPDSASN